MLSASRIGSQGSANRLFKALVNAVEGAGIKGLKEWKRPDGKKLLPRRAVWQYQSVIAAVSSGLVPTRADALLLTGYREPQILAPDPRGGNEGVAGLVCAEIVQSADRAPETNGTDQRPWMWATLPRSSSGEEERVLYDRRG